MLRKKEKMFEWKRQDLYTRFCFLFCLFFVRLCLFVCFFLFSCVCVCVGGGGGG